jgi:hypothetical protein
VKIQATTQHSPWYSSRRHVAIIGDILWHDVNIVVEEGDFNERWKNEWRKWWCCQSVVRLFSLSFFAFWNFEFPAKIKKGGGKDPPGEKCP